MPGTINIGKKAMDVHKSDAGFPYSRVVVIVDEETEYSAGNDTGETLEVECPWGTQEMANDLLEKMRGVIYQPYTANTAIVEPSAELGDAVQVNGVFGGLYQQDSTFGHTFYSDFSAPSDEQLDHEFTYKSATERKINRNQAWAKTEFRITNEAISAEAEARAEDMSQVNATFELQGREINAKVAQTGGDNSSFGWSLVSDAFRLYSGNRAVFTCNSSGVNIDGTITARSGYIGNGSTGFTIGNTFIRNGMTSRDDTSNNGVYVGTDGFACGAGKFKVTNAGKLTATDVDISGKITATSGTFTGTVNATSGYFDGTIYANRLVFSDRAGNPVTISAANLTNGTISSGKLGDGSVTEGKIGGGAVSNGKIAGSAVTGDKVQNGTLSKSKGNSAANTSWDNGDNALDTVTKLMAGSITATFLETKYLIVYKGGNVSRQALWKTGATVVTDVNFSKQTVTTTKISDYLGY